VRAQAIAEAQPQSQERIRHSPSPPHLASASHHRYGHKRRDSDTLKSLSSHHIQPSTSPTSSPPPIEALPARLSPSAHHLQFPSSSSSNAALSSSASARHRRSPTAPDIPTTSGSLHPGNGLGRGKTWSGDEMAANGDEYGHNPGSHGSVPIRQHSRQQQQNQYASAPAAVPAPAPQPQQQQQAQDGRNGRSNMVVRIDLGLLYKISC
jgi:serine/threonine-protein kinase TTK/MPS1